MDFLTFSSSSLVRLNYQVIIIMSFPSPTCTSSIIHPLKKGTLTIGAQQLVPWQLVPKQLVPQTTFPTDNLSHRHLICNAIICALSRSHFCRESLPVRCSSVIGPSVRRYQFCWKNMGISGTFGSSYLSILAIKTILQVKPSHSFKWNEQGVIFSNEGLSVILLTNIQGQLISNVSQALL